MYTHIYIMYQIMEVVAVTYPARPDQKALARPARGPLVPALVHLVAHECSASSLDNFDTYSSNSPMS